eukprot:COSAG04_NODE_29574_length_268_cov_0.615385_1_plen_81_part_01
MAQDEASEELLAEIHFLLMEDVDPDAIDVKFSPGSIRISVLGLPQWAASALVSIALGGSDRLSPSTRCSFHQRIRAILQSE